MIDHRMLLGELKAFREFTEQRLLVVEKKLDGLVNWRTDVTARASVLSSIVGSIVGAVVTFVLKQ
jgi:hypothetical protein